MNLIEKSLHYLETSLRDGHWRPGDKLPNYMELGKAIGTSNVTVSKAVKILCDRGVLISKLRIGVWVARTQEDITEGPTEYCARSSNSQKWEKLKSRILFDLIDGKLDPFGSLPSLKELQNHYGVSFGTIKKALESLDKDGIVTRFKKTFKANLFVHKGSSNKLLILVQINPDRYDLSKITLDTKGFIIQRKWRMFFNELERVCKKKNLGFELWGYLFRNNSITFVSPTYVEHSSIENLKDFYGYCILKSYSYVDEMHRLFMMMGATGKPLAIVDESGNGDCIVPAKMKKRHVALFTINESDHAAREIGQYLLELGHQNIAFISPFHKELWSINRYLGICKAFDTFSRTHRVHLYADSQYSPMELQTGDRKFDENFNRFPPLVDIMKTYTHLSEEEIEYFSKRVSEDFMNEFSRLRIERFLQPIFQKTLANSTVTAWVCVDDRIALFALAYLKKRGISVPQQISVVGFEDINDAFLSGLSTYNYDIPSLTHNVLAFLSDTMIFFGKNLPVEETNGYVVARQSTGPAPRIS